MICMFINIVEYLLLTEWKKTDVLLDQYMSQVWEYSNSLVQVNNNNSFFFTGIALRFQNVKYSEVAISWICFACGITALQRGVLVDAMILFTCL